MEPSQRIQMDLKTINKDPNISQDRLASLHNTSAIFCLQLLLISSNPWLRHHEDKPVLNILAAAAVECEHWIPLPVTCGDSRTTCAWKIVNTMTAEVHSCRGTNFYHKQLKSCRINDHLALQVSQRITLTSGVNQSKSSGAGPSYSNNRYPAEICYI